VITVDLEVPARVLAIGAHPDDIEFGCGATLAKWADAGAHIAMCICTDGSKGTWDADADLDALRALRQTEQRAAADVLGATDVLFLGFVDGELDVTLDGRAAICRVIREQQPDVVLTHDPWKPRRLHPDHRVAGQLAIDAIVAARDPHFFADQGLKPHRPSTLLCFEPSEVDHLESVLGYLDRKTDALLAHRSQWLSTMGIEDPDRTAAFVESEHAQARATGIRGGLRAAEAFLRTDDL
jgi:LmbE family N-acetylglucosaminyl deacetylase